MKFTNDYINYLCLNRTFQPHYQTVYVKEQTIYQF
jgi:hypothetical protein